MAHFSSIRIVGLGLAVAAFLSASEASGDGPVGLVRRLPPENGRLLVERPGHQEEARVGTALFPGDTVVLQRGSEAEILIGNQIHTLRSEAPRLFVPASQDQSSSPGAGFTAFLQQLGDRFRKAGSQSPRPGALLEGNRGGGQSMSREPAAATASCTPGASPTPTGKVAVQHVTAGRRPILAILDGREGPVVECYLHQSNPDHRSRGSFVLSLGYRACQWPNQTVPLGDFTLELETACNGTLTYTMRGVSEREVPSPPWLDGHPSQTPADRALTGLWLVSADNLDRWRIEGLSRLWAERSWVWARFGLDLIVAGYVPF